MIPDRFQTIRLVNYRIPRFNVSLKYETLIAKREIWALLKIIAKGCTKHLAKLVMTEFFWGLTKIKKTKDKHLLIRSIKKNQRGIFKDVNEPQILLKRFCLFYIKEIHSATYSVRCTMEVVCIAPQLIKINVYVASAFFYSNGLPRDSEWNLMSD